MTPIPQTEALVKPPTMEQLGGRFAMLNRINFFVSDNEVIATLRKLHRELTIYVNVKDPDNGSVIAALGHALRAKMMEYPWGELDLVCQVPSNSIHRIESQWKQSPSEPENGYDFDDILPFEKGKPLDYGDMLSIVNALLAHSSTRPEAERLTSARNGTDRNTARMDVVDRFMTSEQAGFLSVHPTHLEYLGGAIWQLYCNEYGHEVLSQTDISEAIRTSYFASLEIDEGRFFPFSALLLIEEERGGIQYSEFSEELECSPRNIAKLAPALLHTRRSMILRVKKQKLWISGIGERAEGVMELTSLRAGSLSLKFPSQQRDSAVVAHINKKTVIVEPNFGDLPFDNELALGMRNGISGEFATRFGFVYEILRRIYAFERGGILIIAGDENWRDSVLFGNSFDLQDDMAFGALSDSIIGGDIEAAIRSGYANDIASLSRVDGATLIRPDFQVLTFGAKLQPRWSGQTIESYIEVSPGIEAGMGHMVGELRNNHRSISEVGGTRHRSSAQFAQDHHGSVVFTASEDGPISTFFWSDEDESVVRVRNSEAFIL